ncbi:MAG: endonuclease/exonuclease/phosphatase family protein [Alphaproteobacteria bacterium]|nr:endonuclease/exonuclease/phosphatase family protein [Alphaproteobacteria bacterium]
MSRFLVFAVRRSVILGLFGVAMVIAGALGAPWHWVFDLTGQFLLPAFVVALAIVPVAAFARWPGLAAAGAAAAVACYALTFPYTTAPSPVTGDPVRFRVLLFNVWYSNQRLADVAQMIAKVDADLVVIIEAPQRVRNALQQVGSTYPYRFDCAGSDCDALMFSRARLLPQEVRVTSDPDHSPYVTVSTDIAGCKLTLLATHMTRPFPNQPYWAQRAQAREIGSAVGLIPGQKLVLGDFNAAPWGYVMRTIAARGGVSVLTGPGGTWPSVLVPQLRIPIDHMLASPGLSFVSREVLPRIGSDHAPVLAEIAVTDRSQCR